ncbi:hypothetical protein F4804DRAFT_314189 [Jackrogersella minutella]|nr:hypothetical protein F4804DRAFT_314189 [Jackrogersella minutella]
MSLDIFCCSSISPFRPQRLDHEAKFTAFMSWARVAKSSEPHGDGSASMVSSALYAVQLIRQINYGPQESTRYFVPLSNGSSFAEAVEDDLIKSNFEKLNSYKNFRCSTHDKFFEVNLYQKNPTNTHHWRSNLARPSRDIDLAFRPQKGVTETVEQLPAQEKKHEPTTVGHNDAAQDLPGPHLPALEETQKAAPKEKEIEYFCPPNNEALKRMLRFILPAVGKKLGSNSLVTLLCLDQISTELNLGLDFESLWEREFTRSNILSFINCIAACNADKLSVDQAKADELVMLAIFHSEPDEGDMLTGRDKLYEIIKLVVGSGVILNGEPEDVEDILRVFTSSPSEALLEHCRRKEDMFPREERKLDVESSVRAESDEDDRLEWWPDHIYHDFDYTPYDSDRDSMKDFTACDKECGYCGRCEY